jgi:hypothetical protein
MHQDGVGYGYSVWDFLDHVSWERWRLQTASEYVEEERTCGSTRLSTLPIVRLALYNLYKIL